ncbi:hypothetical protein ABIB40_003001 [Pedobacter sp. UYP30]|uniref:DUF4397 domain-containing protein n=1 Tax=Pedobacter sp. UYP30 TaxID=1756400 RepID=UPI003393F1C9
MTTHSKKLNITAKLFCALFALTIILAACAKSDPTPPIEAAGIGFIHASPGTGALDFVVDGQKVNSFTYTQDFGYYTAYPGTRLIGVAKKDSTTYLAKDTVNLKPGTFYSFFVVDTLKSTKILALEDDLTAPAADKAKIRFVNLSPGSPALDLSIANADTALVKNKAFKAFSSFAPIAPNASYTFEVKQTGTSSVKATLPAVKIEAGKIYTIWAKGLASKTDSTAFGLSIMPNK